MRSPQAYDTIIIGGGFYGLRTAQYLYDELGQKNILILEKEAEVLSRASYNNQARVHNGYHYPRSVLTALRSSVNFPVFAEEYETAIVKNFTKYYAVANGFSKVSARQFKRFCEMIGLKVVPAPTVKGLFNPQLVDDVYEVEEYAFDASVLRQILLDELNKRGIEIHTAERVTHVKEQNSRLKVTSENGEYSAGHVLNTTYSSINQVNQASGLPLLPLKHELTEMCLVNVAPDMQDKAFTVMCGPFFSIMPFPSKNVFTLSHVRYTPHSEWSDTGSRNPHDYMASINKVSHFPQMYADLKRFMPQYAKGVTYTGESLWEIKTVLPQSEQDDSRPILYKDHYGGLKNYICIMGAKIDNIYEVFKELEMTYDKSF